MKQSKKTKQIAIWLLFTVLAFTLAIVWDRSTRNEVSATSSPAVAEKTNPSVHGTKIQNIQLGERVVGKNPQENDGLDESILTEIPHVGYNLLFKKPDGTHSSIELLRPKNWLETEKIVLREVSKATTSDELLKNAIRQKSSDGKDCNIEVYIDLPEMGTVGWATLISIKENIEIKEGHGNVVTGRFRHVANNVIDLQVEGVEKIGCTDNHPIWSVDREDFIEAGKLVEGERVLLYNGETRRVVQKLPRPGPQYVNNLEVFGEHVYHVTLDGLLVHNSCEISKIADDWVDKGFHLKTSDGTEISLRPDHTGSFILCKTFSKTTDAEFKIASKEFYNALKDKNFQNKLLREAKRAREYLREYGTQNAVDKSGEMTFLIKALERLIDK